MSEEHVEVVRAYIEAYNDKDLQALESVIAETLSFDGDDIPRDDFLAVVQNYWNAFPDMTISPTHHVADGEGYVLSRDIVTATGEGEYYGHDVDGKSIEAGEMTLFHVSDGVIDEYWFEWDGLTFWNQLGVVDNPYE